MLIASYDQGGFGGCPWKSRAELAALVTDRCFCPEKKKYCAAQNIKLLMSELIVLCVREEDFASIYLLKSFFILNSKISFVYDS